ncbi:heterokaryon incompatibility, partial [Hyaloscypha sp. PMI_1271]
VKYIALSYTWGDHTPTAPILLDGQRFFVTKNLYSFLQHFRQPPGYGSFVYWIDAICINQGDVREKDKQVQRMKQIYEGADEVYVWLGPEADDSHLAMRKLDSLNKYFRQQGPDEAAPQIMMSLMNQEDTSWMFGPPSEPFDERPWRALEKLFARPWWTRVWIIQE